MCFNKKIIKAGLSGPAHTMALPLPGALFWLALLDHFLVACMTVFYRVHDPAPRPAIANLAGEPASAGQITLLGRYFFRRRAPDNWLPNTRAS
jgi:hypothetical protein